mmetsp:Transcript_9985/g.12592  ORF Transcript_9985/g.12592 Transcript_9985/m.12592 type:complete len:189 (+) Transcript_9985:135-701(+)|eukprot:CAMPEP_0203642904 /NCGR_PEP_ID=MMETSP0088-20131115/8315_1 /ASSEMBLY_ACC=CAM_ASM_001087 /TAXON_ID=426623 /ORGANISM="Chaetoceros affinis, Strain CCMP159" /LENGTH=188 /DNA_ID=CAMNT_0050498881 /DNA_START=108 /DNA_END=674 /DNA_ORIENTATION=+
MVRSLKFIGALLSVVASTTSGFTPQQPRFSRSSWGVSTSTSSSNNIAAIRNIPTTALSAMATQRESTVMMPAVLDKPTVSPGGPAVLDRPAVEKRRESAPVKERKRTGSEAWEVRIYNDGMNTREFVARCLVQITGLSEITAYQTMMQAHQNGVAVVGRYVYEIAEMYHNALKKNGIVCDLVPVDEEK